jgi:hypothetical protein
MPRKKCSQKQIIYALRQVEGGMKIGDIRCPRSDGPAVFSSSPAEVFGTSAWYAMSGRSSSGCAIWPFLE